MNAAFHRLSPDTASSPHCALRPVAQAAHLCTNGHVSGHLARCLATLFPDARPVAVALGLGCLALLVMPAVWAQQPTHAAGQEPDRVYRLVDGIQDIQAEGGSTSGLRAGLQLEADRIEGQLERRISAYGNAILRRPGSMVRSDVLRYDQYLDLVSATGAVRINHLGNTFAGDTLQLAMDTYRGYMNNVRYRIARTGGYGRASRVDFVSSTRTVAHDATYTTCTQCVRSGKEPAWYVRAKKITADTRRDEGWVEGGGALVFKGVPIVPLPSGVGFPLSDKRRSGLLPPAVTYNSQDHLAYSQPFYLDIAPNRDATITPTIMTGRGINAAAEFRYLEQNYTGQLSGSYMPSDRLRNRHRWQYLMQHTQQFPQLHAIPGTVGLDVRLQRASDHDYWRDFSIDSDTAANPTASSRILPSRARLHWQHQYWSGFLLAQKWQTLQQPAPNHIIPPFDRLPQLHLRYARPAINALTYTLDADITRFQADQNLTGQPNGIRSYVQGQVSYPFTRPWGYLTPSLQLHARRYHTSSPMPDGRRSASITVPTVTLDGGLVFERDRTLLDRPVTQTLEPRLFYAFTPQRDQNALPIYDSALKDFNLASIFSPNPFTGHDRQADINALSAGLTTRVYDRSTGAELANASIAGRHQFTRRQVRLNPSDTADRSSFSDVLLDANWRWNPRWRARMTWAFDPNARRTQRGIAGVSYHPGPYRSVSLNYHLQRYAGEQIDIGWQWPINDLWGDRGQNLGAGRGQGPGRWYSVGRVYYSLYSNRAVTPAVGKGVVDAMIGLEYDACCWIARFGLRRQQTQVAPVKYSNKIMLQIEFNGLSRIGSNPLGAFRQQVPNYTPLRIRPHSLPHSPD